MLVPFFFGCLIAFTVGFVKAYHHADAVHSHYNGQKREFKKLAANLEACE